MMRTVVSIIALALLFACDQSMPTQPDGPVPKASTDQPGGLLAGT